MSTLTMFGIVFGAWIVSAVAMFIWLRDGELFKRINRLWFIIIVPVAIVMNITMVIMRIVLLPLGLIFWGLHRRYDFAKVGYDSDLFHEWKQGDKTLNTSLCIMAWDIALLIVVTSYLGKGCQKTFNYINNGFRN